MSYYGIINGATLPPNWMSDLREQIGLHLAKQDGDESTVRIVFIDPMDRADAYLIHATGIADTVLQIHNYEGGRFAIFQPSIPREVTSYHTEPPIKTRPLNCDADMDNLADAIAYFSDKEFLRWQGKAILESDAIAQWRGQSAAFLASLTSEPWCPTVSMGDDGSVKATVGRVTCKAGPGKITITFAGPATEYMDVIRGALRDEHRCREALRAGEGGDGSDQEEFEL